MYIYIDIQISMNKYVYKYVYIHVMYYINYIYEYVNICKYIETHTQNHVLSICIGPGTLCFTNTPDQTQPPGNPPPPC